MSKGKAIKIELELREAIIQQAEMELAHILQDWRQKAYVAIDNRVEDIRERFVKELTDQATEAVMEIVNKAKAKK